MCFCFPKTLAFLALEWSLSLDGIHQANTGSLRSSQLEQQVKLDEEDEDDTFLNLDLINIFWKICVDNISCPVE